MLGLAKTTHAEGGLLGKLLARHAPYTQQFGYKYKKVCLCLFVCHAAKASKIDLNQTIDSISHCSGSIRRTLQVQLKLVYHRLKLSHLH